MKALLPTLVVLVSLLAAPVSAQSYEDGLAAWDRADWAGALHVLQPFAERGDERAQEVLGQIYYDGLAVDRDYTEALKWFKLSAEQGNANSQLELGMLFAAGEGVPRHYAEALKWFKLSAEQGNANSQYLLGLMFGRGEGVPRDYLRSYMWLNLSSSGAGDEGDRKERSDLLDKLEDEMTNADISKAQQMSRNWLKAHPQ